VRIDAFTPHFFHLEAACRVVADFPDVPRRQPPPSAGDKRTRDLPSRLRFRGGDLNLAIDRRKARETDHRIGRVDPNAGHQSMPIHVSLAVAHVLFRFRRVIALDGKLSHKTLAGAKYFRNPLHLDPTETLEPCVSRSA
jgi:hypothetical protein